MKSDKRTMRQKWDENVTVRARAQYLQSWCEICNVDDPNDIDYDNPHVKIQSTLCSPSILYGMATEKGRQRFFDIVGPEATEVYLTYVGDDGSTYRDVEKIGKKDVLSAVKNTVIKQRKNKHLQ